MFKLDRFENCAEVGSAGAKVFFERLVEIVCYRRLDLFFGYVFTKKNLIVESDQLDEVCHKSLVGHILSKKIDKRWL